MDALNKRRLRYLSENDDRIYRLEIALERLNQGGGLGFVIFGVAIDKHKLAKVGTLALTAAPTLITTLRNHVVVGEGCETLASSSSE